MGPHYPKRFEEYHGLDEHPNGLAPEPEEPGFRKYLPLVKCPQCMGEGYSAPPGTIPPEAERIIWRSDWTECDTCEDAGKVTIPELLRYTVGGLKQIARDALRQLRFLRDLVLGR